MGTLAKVCVSSKIYWKHILTIFLSHFQPENLLLPPGEEFIGQTCTLLESPREGFCAAAGPITPIILSGQICLWLLPKTNFSARIRQQHQLDEWLLLAPQCLHTSRVIYLSSGDRPGAIYTTTSYITKRDFVTYFIEMIIICLTLWRLLFSWALILVQTTTTTATNQEL